MNCISLGKVILRKLMKIILNKIVRYLIIYIGNYGKAIIYNRSNNGKREIVVNKCK
jgi:hypothetical protein